jgi:shikimate dehydrogenase
MAEHHTELFGIIGFPLGHSMSPVMHNAAFTERGIDAVYLPFETKDPAGSLMGMRAFGIKGLSVTIPHKTIVLPLLDEVNELARRIGAVNTILNHESRLTGYNTDALGAMKALKKKIDPQGKSCLIMGAGGAAKAIGWILKENGASITITNRSQERGKRLSFSLDCPFTPLEDLKDLDANILIHTTSVGMSPNREACLISEQLFKEGMVVMDIVYNPLETELLKRAKRRGCATISGLEMFIQQGAEQFRLWTGLKPPITVMRRAVKETLSHIESETNEVPLISPRRDDPEK